MRIAHSNKIQSKRVLRIPFRIKVFNHGYRGLTEPFQNDRVSYDDRQRNQIFVYTDYLAFNQRFASVPLSALAFQQRHARMLQGDLCFLF